MPRAPSSPKRSREPRLAAGLAAGLALLLPLAAGSNGAPGAEPASGAARLSSGEAASEYWDLTARLDSGHRVFARFLISNEGPGSHSAAAIGHVLRPDGTSVRFDNAKGSGEWDVSSDGLRLHISSSILDLTPPHPKFEYDSNKRGVKLHLWFEPGSPLARPEDPALPDYALDLLDPAAPVHGTLWLRGMAAPIPVTGLLALTHTRMERSESDLAARRIDFFSLSGDTSVYLSELTTPAGGRSRWLVVERGAERVFAGGGFELELEPPAGGGDYPVPAALRLRAPGVQGRIGLAPVLLQDDPFEALPGPFRFLLSWKASPRRVWAESPFELRLGSGGDAPAALFEGSGITSVTFPNPLPPELSGALRREPRA